MCIFVPNDIDETKHRLKALLDKSVLEKYGDEPDLEIIKRLEDEWAAIGKINAFSKVAAVYETTQYLKKNIGPYFLDFNSGASFILYMLGITMGNPLPPHYWCKKCKRVIWKDECLDGFDLAPKRLCLHDRGTLIGDGHNIPWEALWGYDYFSVTIKVKPSFFDRVLDFATSYWHKERNLSVENGYYEFSNSEKKLRYIKIEDVDIVFEFHEELSFYMFYNREITANDRKYILSNWREYYKLLPGMPEPKTISDLIAAFGMLNSNGAWDKDAQFMVEKLGYSLSELISCREDVYFYLLRHDLSIQNALFGMKYVRQGRGLPFITDEMTSALDKWVLKRFERVTYLPSKAGIIERLLYQMQIEEKICSETGSDFKCC